MKNILFCAAALAIGLGAQAQSKQKFDLTGELTGLKDGEQVYLLHQNAERKMDTLKGSIKEGRFEIKGDVVGGADFYTLKAEGKRIIYNLFVDASSIKVAGSADDLSKVQITGSPAHADYLAHKSLMAPFGDQMKALNVKYRTAKQGGNETQAAQVSEEMDVLEQKMDAATTGFISSHRASLYSPYLLFGQGCEPSTTAPVFNQLSKAAQISKYGKKIKERMGVLAMVAVGQKAPEFTSLTPEGNQLSLKEVVAKGKVTLIDFWASWCGPCRAENPNVVAAYAKFHDKGLNILGVSLDRENGAEAWKKAILNDHLTWYQVSDLKYWDSAAAKLYAVSGIPHSVLVDANGIIIAKNLRGKALQEKLAELLGK